MGLFVAYEISFSNLCRNGIVARCLNSVRWMLMCGLQITNIWCYNKCYGLTRVIYLFKSFTIVIPKLYLPCTCQYTFFHSFYDTLTMTFPHLFSYKLWIQIVSLFFKQYLSYILNDKFKVDTKIIFSNICLYQN